MMIVLKERILRIGGPVCSRWTQAAAGARLAAGGAARFFTCPAWASRPTNLNHSIKWPKKDQGGRCYLIQGMRVRSEYLHQVTQDRIGRCFYADPIRGSRTLSFECGSLRSSQHAVDSRTDPLQKKRKATSFPRPLSLFALPGTESHESILPILACLAPGRHPRPSARVARPNEGSRLAKSAQ